MKTGEKTTSSWLVIIAFATIYIVWGSTYFFIQLAIHDFPPLLMGTVRFLVAGFLLLLWCFVKGEKLGRLKPVKVAAITGVLLLFCGNGAVIWAERIIPSSLAAIVISAAPLWFVLIDKPKWRANLSNGKVITGLAIGFLGVLLLFAPQLKHLLTGQLSAELGGLGIIVLGSMCWAGGSIYGKYHASGSSLANATWQMLSGGLAFLVASLLSGEWKSFHFSAVHTSGWLALLYLIFLGSIAAYSAYVWLLTVRPATQVSTYAYVNPVVAVLLGVLFAGEKLSLLQLGGLGVILLSVLLINQSKK